MKIKSALQLTLIILVVAALSGCNLPFGGTPVEPTIPPTQDLNLLATLTQQALIDSVQETETAPTATLSPTPTLEPVLTDTPGPTPTSGPIPLSEIKFLQGGTIAYLRGTLLAGEKKAFTLGAGGGQTLISSVSSEGNQVYFEIKDLESDEILVPFSDQTSSAQLKLPWTGDYQITLSSPEDLDYFLSVEVPANLVVSPGMGASVVTGTINVQQAFHPDVFTRVRYLMQLQAGSVLNAQINTFDSNDLALALIGAGDGQPYLRYEVQTSTISGFVVPESQGYYLDVYSISGNSVSYSVSITVE